MLLLETTSATRGGELWICTATIRLHQMDIHVVNRNKKRVLLVKRYTHDKRMNALLNAKASLAIEGIRLSTREEQLILKRVKGEVNNTEFIALAMEIAKNV